MEPGPSSSGRLSRTPPFGCYGRASVSKQNFPTEKRVLYFVNSHVQTDSLVLKMPSCAMLITQAFCRVLGH